MSENTKRMTMAEQVCSMFWMSVSGWDNRPDYFDTNDLKLMADLAFLANVEPEALSEACEGTLPSDSYDLSCGMQNSEKLQGLYAFLKAYGEDPLNPPLQASLAKYEKYRLAPKNEDVPLNFENMEAK